MLIHGCKPKIMRKLMLNNLTPKIKEVIEMYLLNPSMTQRDIAKAVGLSEGRISMILNSPRVHEVYPVLARRRIRSTLLPKALERYEKIIGESQNDAVAEKAASKVLSNEGVFDGPTVKLDGEIRIRDVRELQEIVQKAVVLPASDILEAEIIAPDTTHDTTHPEA